MIHISCTYYSKSIDIYTVKLGNGTIHEFKSEAKCISFLAKTSKFLTKRYNELNLLYSDVFTLYRQIYFYFDNDKKNPKAKSYEIRRQINKSFSQIEKMFERLTFSNCHSSSNQIQFFQINSIIEGLIFASVNIKSINENKSYAATQVRAEFLINQLSTISNQIKSYSLEKATAYENPSANPALINYRSNLKIVS